METKISLPDPLFRDASRLARRLKISRSELYQRAIAAFLAQHAPEPAATATNEGEANADADQTGRVVAGARSVLAKLALAVLDALD